MNRTRTLMTATLAVLALAGCGSTAKDTPAGPQAVASTIPGITPAASSSGPDCATQFTTWRDSGGLSDLQAVTSDLGTVSQAASALATDMDAGSLPPADEAALQQASAGLQSDTATAQADLPPSCVPGLRRNVSAGLTDYNRAAVEAGQAVTAADGGSYSLAASDLVAAGKAMGAGNGKIRKATAAIQAYSGG
jgi:hypothetical protein